MQDNHPGLNDNVTTLRILMRATIGDGELDAFLVEIDGPRDNSQTAGQNRVG